MFSAAVLLGSSRVNSYLENQLDISDDRHTEDKGFDIILPSYLISAVCKMANNNQVPRLLNVFHAQLS